MKTKLQFIALASLAVMGAGCLAVTAGVTANQNTQLSLNAETINETVGYVRLWVSSDKNNPINRDGCYPKLWIHTGSGTDDWNKGSDVYVTEKNEFVEMQNTEEWENTDVYQGYRIYYYYFDVPVANVVGNYLTIQRFEINDDAWKNQSGTIQITQENVGQVFYLWDDQTTISTGGPGKLSAALAAKGVEGLQTCSSSNINGFNAFPQIANTFILNENGDWKLPSGQNLDQVEISDYASIDDYATGKRTITMNAYDKAAILARMSNVTLHKN